MPSVGFLFNCFHIHIKGTSQTETQKEAKLNMADKNA